MTADAPSAQLAAFAPHLAPGAPVGAPVAETGAARVWRVRLADGSDGALKVWPRGHPGNEAAGLSYLRALGPGRAARIVAARTDAVLMAWIDGPSLGDALRAGRVREADRRLGRVAADLLADPPDMTGLPSLEAWLSALWTLRVAPEAPDGARADVDRCREMARTLLADPREAVALHGDLHHDNVLLAADGPRVIDAKGLRGEAAFELANAFRNPKGAPDECFDAAHLVWRAQTWGAALGVPPRRMAQWGAVKAALSIAWSCGGVLAEHPQLPLLARLVASTGWLR